MALAAQLHGAFDTGAARVWQIVVVTALCELCFYYNDLYDLTIVHSKRELLVRLLQAAGAAAIVLAVAGVRGSVAHPRSRHVPHGARRASSSRSRRGASRSTVSRTTRTSRSAC